MIRTTFFILSLTAVASAQSTSFSLATSSDYGNYAKAGSSAMLKFVKKGTPITSSLSVRAAVRGAGAASTVGLSRTRDGARILVGESGSASGSSASAGTTTSTDSRNVKLGAHSLVAKLAVKSGTKVRLALSFAGRVAGRAAAGVAVDLDGDSTPDWTAKADGKEHSKVFVLTASSTGIQVSIATEASVVGGSSAAGYGARFSATFGAVQDARRCVFRPYGRSCGPVLAGAEERQGSNTIAAFKTSKAQPGGLALFIMGSRQIAARIPGTNCGLFTVPLLIFGRAVDSSGNAEIKFLVPGDFQGTVYNQDIILARSSSGISVKSTNGVQLSCRKAQ